MGTEEQTNFSQLKVADLKELCKEHGLATTGLKADLIGRLEERGRQLADTAEGSADGGASTAPAPAGLADGPAAPALAPSPAPNPAAVPAAAAAAAAAATAAPAQPLLPRRGPELPNGTNHGAADNNNGGNGCSSKAADKRKEKKKKQKERKQLRRQQQSLRGSSVEPSAAAGDDEGGAASEGVDEEVEIEYVSAPIELPGALGDAMQEEDERRPTLGLGLGFTSNGDGGGEQQAAAATDDPYADFKRIFEKFAKAEELTGGAAARGGGSGDEDEEAGGEGAAATQAAEERARAEKKATTSDSDSDDEEGDGEGKKLSRKAKKLLTRVSIAELKQACERPDVVEMWDVTAPDPFLLVALKAARNTAAVPRHWSQKRKYLQGKRGLEKPPFKLPDFIEATGIAQMRQSYQEKEDAKKLKQKARDRMAPKMGKMDIDYQVLHDAFFRHQAKPKLSGLAELYYEGKEFEAVIERSKPGILSAELKAALGMADGGPPPWLVNMQRYGPPPSYPNLRIAGLNAPIPPGASFGYQPGGWGKPPVDEHGAPLYGDVFGVQEAEEDLDEGVDKASRWGELEPEAEPSEEEEEEEEEDEGGRSEEEYQDGIATGMTSGMASGISSSLPSGIETPQVVNLRKATEAAEAGRPLYTVLEQKQVSVGAGIMGTDHVYVLPADGGGGGAGEEGGEGGGRKRKFDALKGLTGDVEVTISPEELEGLDEGAIRALYEERLAAVKAANRREDFSDLVAEKAAQQKRKIAQKADAKAAKKAGGGKDTFKF